MRFGNPYALWALLALPALAAFLAWSNARRRTLLERYAAARLLPALGVVPSILGTWLRPGITMLACALIIIATARPQWGHEDRKIVSRGVDVIVAVDCSLSMQAQDYRPSRQERAKELLQDVIWRARGDRIGVIAFAGSAVVKCPLTLDYGMASTALKTIGPGAVATGGTAIGTAIDSAIRAFEVASAGERVLVLLTDGEDQGSQPIEAANRAAKAGIKIYTIGIGTTQGSALPDPESGGAPKVDRSGKRVLSKLDFQSLTEIARITGGKAVKANPRGEAELDVIFSDLSRLQKAQQQDRVYRVYRERFGWFLIPAMVLLVLEAIMVGVPRHRRSVGRLGEVAA